MWSNKCLKNYLLMKVNYMGKKVFLAVLVMSFCDIKTQVEPVRRFSRTEEGQRFIRMQTYIGGVMWGAVLGYMLSSEKNGSISSLIGGMIGYFLMYTILQSDRLRKLEKLVDEQGKFIGSPAMTYPLDAKKIGVDGQRLGFVGATLAEWCLANAASTLYLSQGLVELRKKQNDHPEKVRESQN